MTVNCPCCNKTFATQKKAQRHLRDAMRESKRLANGKTIVRKIGQAQIDPKTLLPVHMHNGKQSRKSVDLDHVSRFDQRVGPRKV